MTACEQSDNDIVWVLLHIWLISIKIFYKFNAIIIIANFYSILCNISNKMRKKASKWKRLCINQTSKWPQIVNICLSDCDLSEKSNKTDSASHFWIQTTFFCLLGLRQIWSGKSCEKNVAKRISFRSLSIAIMMLFELQIGQQFSFEVLWIMIHC